MDLSTDVRHAFRSLASSRGYALTAVLTLALGLASVSTIFAVVDTVLLRPLHFDHPERVFTVGQTVTAMGPGLTVATLDEFQRWRQTGLFEDVAALDTAEYTLTSGGRAERLYGVSVTPDFFRVFRLQPFLGRGFRHDDAVAGHDHVMVLSHELWVDRFGADPSVLGKTFTFSGTPITVIGVMPPGFDFPRVADVRSIMHWAPERSEFWTPLAISPEMVHQGNFNYYVFGRLRDGVTPARASQQLRAVAVRIFHEISAQYPDFRGEIERMIPALTVPLIPLRDTMSLGVRGALWMLLAAVGLMLSLVLFNLGNLLLTRNANRLREYVVREALGATRWQLFRQSMAEQLMVIAAAACLSVALTSWGLFAIRAIAAARLPRLYELSFDMRAATVLAILALAVALLFGALPLILLRRSPLAATLQNESRGATADRRTNRWKSTLMVAEIAVSTVLLIGAGLLLKSFRNVNAVNPGFDPHNVLTLTVSLNPKASDNARIARIRETLQTMRRIPGVEASAVINHLPLTGESDIHNLRAGAANFPGAEYRVVDETYFRTMRIPVFAGRVFREGESKGSAIVNRRLAETIWPGQDPLGKQFSDGENPPLVVIGVVGDIHDGSLESRPRMQFYEPLESNPWADQFIIRTRIDPNAILPAVQRAVWRLDPEQAVSHPQTMDRLLAASTLQRRFETGLITGFAAAALLLAAIGLFGVASLSAARRTREFGVRLALGARGTDLLRLEMRRTLLIVAAGLACGLAMSLALARAVAGLLYGVRPWSPAIYGAAIAAMLIPAFAAAWIPARRAARVDAASALRCE